MSDKEIHESYTMMKKLELLSTLLTKPGTKKIEAMRGKKIGLGCTITRNLGLFVETNVSSHYFFSSSVNHTNVLSIHYWTSMNWISVNLCKERSMLSILSLKISILKGFGNLL